MEKTKASPLSEAELDLLHFLDQELEVMHQQFSFEVLLETISKLMNPLPVNAKDSEELNQYIKWLKINFKDERKVFTCKRQELIYYLTQHSNGKERKNKLGVNNEWYSNCDSNKKEIKRWYKGISHALRADLTYYPDNENARIAFNKLREMIDEMGLSIDEVESGN
ncbi:hypothetical protein [Pseudoalteromonas sp. DY56-GL79]|uniref:hypothetical protein n=1 Tax=Pseudoalteromonas sp. DY56-GL79 TaxID=2967131 RepID=UPI00352B1EC1